MIPSVLTTGPVHTTARFRHFTAEITLLFVNVVSYLNGNVYQENVHYEWIDSIETDE